jgi:dienelactone hydrolase
MSCPDCFKGVIHSHSTPTGHIETLFGKETYIATPPSTSTSTSTILFCCDAFGLNLINNKLLADQYATLTGFRVLVPHLIPGGGISLNVMSVMDTLSDKVAWYDIFGQLRRIVAILLAIRYFAPFMMRANPPKAMPNILAFARKVKASLPPGAKLGVCGFCWGGYPATALCSETAVKGGGERLIDASFCAHPSALKAPEMIVDAITKYKVPYSLAHAGLDFNLTSEKVDEGEAILRERVGRGEGENGCWYEFRVYEGCHHGFAARAKPGDEVEMKGAEEAKYQAVEWFKRWL